MFPGSGGDPLPRDTPKRRSGLPTLGSHPGRLPLPGLCAYDLSSCSWPANRPLTLDAGELLCRFLPAPSAWPQELCSVSRLTPVLSFLQASLPCLQALWHCPVPSVPPLARSCSLRLRGQGLSLRTLQVSASVSLSQLPSVFVSCAPSWHVPAGASTPSPQHALPAVCSAPNALEPATPPRP